MKTNIPEWESDIELAEEYQTALDARDGENISIGENGQIYFKNKPVFGQFAIKKLH